MERLRTRARRRPRVVEFQSADEFLNTYNALAEARAKAIAECVEAAQSVVRGWRSDLDESWDERPDLSFEAADKIAGAREVIAALESLAKGGGEDG